MKTCGRFSRDVVTRSIAYDNWRQVRRGYVIFQVLLAFLCSCCLTFAAESTEEDGWVSLFNGKDLEGWRASENSDSFQVVDGMIIVKGPRAHLFYTGPVEDAKFKNFDWKCEVLLKPQANSGMYFHTEYQEEGWPEKGFEVQLNNTHGDPRKTGGLYAIDDVMNESPVEDNEWFTQQITVDGKRIVVRVNDQVTTDYTEPDNARPRGGFDGRKLSEGTIAIQAHDPGSEIHIRKIMIKPLP